MSKRDTHIFFVVVVAMNLEAIAPRSECEKHRLISNELNTVFELCLKHSRKFVSEESPTNTQNKRPCKYKEQEVVENLFDVVDVLGDGNCGYYAYQNVIQVARGNILDEVPNEHLFNEKVKRFKVALRERKLGSLKRALCTCLNFLHEEYAPDVVEEDESLSDDSFQEITDTETPNGEEGKTKCPTPPPNSLFLYDTQAQQVRNRLKSSNKQVEAEELQLMAMLSGFIICVYYVPMQKWIVFFPYMRKRKLSFPRLAPRCVDITKCVPCFAGIPMLFMLQTGGHYKAMFPRTELAEALHLYACNNVGNKRSARDQARRASELKIVYNVQR